jgi:hypothetical protein
MKTPEETMKDIVKQVNDITGYTKLAKAAADRMELGLASLPRSMRLLSRLIMGFYGCKLLCRLLA